MNYYDQFVEACRQLDAVAAERDDAVAFLMDEKRRHDLTKLENDSAIADRDRLAARVEELEKERERLLNVAYAASYYCNTQRGGSALYDAVRDRENGTDFAEGYRGLARRVDNQADKIGNLQADVKAERDSALLECERLREQWRTRLTVEGEARRGSLIRIYTDKDREEMRAECERLRGENERMHRATIAFILDRVEQYAQSSGYRAFADELVGGIAERRHVQCAEAGEYDDMAKRIDRIIASRTQSKGGS